MYTVRQINKERDSVYGLCTAKQERDSIKAFWKDSFISFVPSGDSRYISFLVRV